MKDRHLLFVFLVFMGATLGLSYGLYQGYLAFEFGETFPFWVLAVGIVSAVVWAVSGAALLNATSPVRYTSESDTNSEGENV